MLAGEPQASVGAAVAFGSPLNVFHNKRFTAMKVVLAEVMGLCFGVRDALKRVEAIAQPHTVTIHGELVHNELIQSRLHSRGFRTLAEGRRQELPITQSVLITAHGISDRERQRLTSEGKKLIDTTCPLVARAHAAAQRLQEEGCHLLVIGRRGHVEVQGIVEDLTSYEVIQDPEEVKHYPFSQLGIMCQTTAPERLVQAIRAAVALHNPDAQIHFIDTVCHPTKEHQRSLQSLLGQVQVVVVVGGRNSNNTRELAARCQERGVPAFHVQSAADLRQEWFAGIQTVGLTAGTSTPDEIIAEVHQALLRIGAAGGTP
jgi:4-hydroxy-3-methylbut-2-enyl diphosphate reductase